MQYHLRFKCPKSENTSKWNTQTQINDLSEVHNFSMPEFT